jgi:nucleotide-binding universal stress UspA family protein
MFKKILLAIDGSEASLGAARVAGMIGAETGAAIRLLTIYDTPAVVLGEPSYSESLDRSLEEADDHLHNATAVIVAAGAARPTRDKLTGNPAEVILATAEEGGHDLIVLGNRGRGRIAGALLGSVSTAVASRAKVPVLIIPHHAA